MLLQSVRLVVLGQHQGGELQDGAAGDLVTSLPHGLVLRVDQRVQSVVVAKHPAQALPPHALRPMYSTRLDLSVPGQKVGNPFIGPKLAHGVFRPERHD